MLCEKLSKLEKSMESQRITREEAKKEAEKIFKEYERKEEEITREAKENGTWSTVGLDANSHLFSELHRETKRKFRELEARIDDTLDEVSSEKSV